MPEERDKDILMQEMRAELNELGASVIPRLEEEADTSRTRSEELSRKVDELSDRVAEIESSAQEDGDESDGQDNTTDESFVEKIEHAGKSLFPYKVEVYDGDIYVLCAKKGDGDEAVKDGFGGSFGGLHYGSSKETKMSDSDSAPWDEDGFAQYGWRKAGETAWETDGATAKQQVVVGEFTFPAEQSGQGGSSSSSSQQGSNGQQQGSGTEGPYLSNLEVVEVYGSGGWLDMCEQSWQAQEEEEGQDRKRKVPLAHVAGSRVVQMCFGPPTLGGAGDGGGNKVKVDTRDAPTCQKSVDWYKKTVTVSGNTSEEDTKVLQLYDFKNPTISTETVTIPTQAESGADEGSPVFLVREVSSGGCVTLGYKQLRFEADFDCPKPCPPELSGGCSGGSFVLTLKNFVRSGSGCVEDENSKSFVTIPGHASYSIEDVSELGDCVTTYKLRWDDCDDSSGYAGDTITVPKPLDGTFVTAIRGLSVSGTNIVLTYETNTYSGGCLTGSGEASVFLSGTSCSSGGAS